jgi:hypothetical protein
MLPGRRLLHTESGVALIHRSPRLLAGIAVVAALPALAVVPGTRSMLRQFADRQALDHIASGELSGQLTYPGKNGPTQVQLSVTFPDTCMAQAVLPEGRVSVSLTHGNVSTKGPPPPSFDALFGLACPLLVLRNVPAATAEERLSQTATGWGVDLSVTSLNLLEGRVAHVIGAKPGDLTHPQLWIDKSSDRPVRVIASRGGRLWDVRFKDPASIATNGIAPRVTELWQDGALVGSLHLLANEIKLPGAAPEESEDDAE